MKIEISNSEQAVKRGDTVICVLQAQKPLFSEGKGAGRLNRYYRGANDVLLSRLRAISSPVDTDVRVKYTVTHNEGGLVSLYRDITFGGDTLRIADTWRDGYPLSLKKLEYSLRRVKRECIAQAERLGRSGYMALFPDYVQRIRSGFDRNNFYISDGAVTVFFPAGAIAPKSYGIMRFTIS